MRHSFACLAVFCCLAAAAIADEPKSTNLPLRRVVMFNSGVGFFEHAGTVSGDAKVEMQFKTADINDLLKSMVVQDLDGGQVSSVTYGSKDPVTKTLKGFSIDLTTNPTLGQLLQQIRGEHVVLESEGPNAARGVILGVETQKRKVGERETIDYQVLNLVTDQGLRAVSLDSVGRIKLANEKLDAELRKALAVLASAHATDKKSVELTFLGKGDRRVRVGYIQAAPVWKTTYRLVFADDKLFLQGWAIVENTSEQDWNNVLLTLVSSRPISFTMELYQPLYISRPQVQLELFSSLQPQAYGQNLAEAQAGEPAPAGNECLSGIASLGLFAGKTMGRRYSPEKAKEGRVMLGVGVNSDAGLVGGVVLDEIKETAQAAARGGNLGNLFRYVIKTPVTLARQQSAMLPIISADVKGEKVSIYNPEVLAEHPLNGLRFTNASELHLMQGPITVFEGGTYAGDAKIEDLPPKAERLISYGIDLDTEVAVAAKSQPEELLSVKLQKGTALVSHKFKRSQEYTIKNSGKKTKTVLVEYPFDANWTLLSPAKPTEKTRDLYRFAVEAKPSPASKPAVLLVEEERTARQQIALNNLDDNGLHYFLGMKVVSEKVKTALRGLVKLKMDLQQTVLSKQQSEERLQKIAADQSRVRQNMDRLDRTGDLYKNYVKKFTAQEEEIDNLGDKISKLTEQETAKRKAIDEYMMNLNVE
jgi:hypothetical protein